MFLEDVEGHAFDPKLAGQGLYLSLFIEYKLFLQPKQVEKCGTDQVAIEQANRTTFTLQAGS
jgi:hypothetical protein